MTIPFYSHTDEGRSCQHVGLWVLSSHGAIGRGTRLYLGQNKHKAPLRRNAMGLNFTGKTWSTNFISGVMLRTPSASYSTALPKLVAEYATDVKHLLEAGPYGPYGDQQGPTGARQTVWGKEIILERP